MPPPCRAGASAGGAGRLVAVVTLSSVSVWATVQVIDSILFLIRSSNFDFSLSSVHVPAKLAFCAKADIVNKHNTAAKNISFFITSPKEQIWIFSPALDANGRPIVLQTM